jgi:hypothetical protein
MCGKVVEQSCTFVYNLRDAATGTDVSQVVERSSEEPEAIYSSTDKEALCVGQETSIGEVRLPLLEGICLFPSLRNPANLDDLADECFGERNVPTHMRWLRGVVGDELSDLFSGPKLCFCGCAEDAELLG